jgi:hypothetical protein
VNAVMNLRVPLNVGDLWSGCTTCGLSSGTQLHRVSSNAGLWRPLPLCTAYLPLVVITTMFFLNAGFPDALLSCLPAFPFCVAGRSSFHVSPVKYVLKI